MSGVRGGTQDPTGLTHLGAREYDPDTGRFISADPLVDTGKPQQVHGYAYGYNNPATFADPSGEMPPPDEREGWHPTVMGNGAGTYGSIGSGGGRGTSAAV